MEIIPVLDLLDGQVVRGVAGNRGEYQPIQSRLVTGSRPLDVARAIRVTFGLQRLYVADLDAIVHQRLNWDVLRTLREDGFLLMVDAGVTSGADAVNLSGIGCEVIAGLETTASPRHLADWVQAVGELTFSLDLRAGRPMFAGNARDWPDGPLEVARRAIDCGIKRLIVLDLADVGMGTGGGTESLCRTILAEHRHLHLTTGGGVRHRDDLLRWQSIGVERVLVASALHDGKLTRDDVAHFANLP